MLPPIDDSILQSNPKFALLHASLTSQILNDDGSTKHPPAQKERDVVTAALKVARIRAAKIHLLRSVLSTMDLSPQSTTSTFTSTSITSRLKPQSQVRATQTTTAAPPAELIELILLLSSYLSTPHPSAPTFTLLSSSPLWATLPSHLPQISILLSVNLHTLSLALARIHSPSTNASYLHRSIPKLTSLLNSHLCCLAQLKASLQTRQITLVGKATTLLSLIHLSTTLSILHLEQTKHGLLSRHLRARTEYLSLLAHHTHHTAAAKRLKGENTLYTPEVRSALDEYVRNLRSGRERLRERKSYAERVLWGYGVGREGNSNKVRVMREIARAYREMQREIADVQRDVGRLMGR